MTRSNNNQYEEYMSQSSGWHWHSFIKSIISNNANPSRIDLALDIFDETTPHVSKIQDYVKRGQLSSRSQIFKEINSGRVLDGISLQPKQLIFSNELNVHMQPTKTRK